MATKKVSKKTNRNPVTTYVRVSDHIYYDGYSYRVRVRSNGVTNSVSVSSKVKAFKSRKTMLATAGR